jgi:hypothetical protein
MVSLLDELRRHSIIDLDCNDEAGMPYDHVAKLHRELGSRLKANAA